MNLDDYMTSDGPAATTSPRQRRLALERYLATEGHDDYMSDTNPKASGWATKLRESLESSKEAGESGSDDHRGYEALTQRYEQALADKYMGPIEEISEDAEYEARFDEKYGDQPPATWDSMVTDLRNRGLL